MYEERVLFFSSIDSKMRLKRFSLETKTIGVSIRLFRLGIVKSVMMVGKGLGAGDYLRCVG